MIKDSLNIDNHSKTFKNAFSINIMLNLLERPNKFDRRQFLVHLYDYVPNMKNCYSIDGLLKDVNVLQKGTTGNPASPLYKDTRKSEYFLSKKHIKITKREDDFQGFASTYNVGILNSFNPDLQICN